MKEYMGIPEFSWESTKRMVLILHVHHHCSRNNCRTPQFYHPPPASCFGTFRDIRRDWSDLCATQRGGEIAVPIKHLAFRCILRTSGCTVVHINNPEFLYTSPDPFSCADPFAMDRHRPQIRALGADRPRSPLSREFLRSPPPLLSCQFRAGALPGRDIHRRICRGISALESLVHGTK